jgi:hypothetical protein
MKRAEEHANFIIKTALSEPDSARFDQIFTSLCFTTSFS